MYLEAYFLNLKFCLYLCWLGVAFTPQFLSHRTLANSLVEIDNLKHKKCINLTTKTKTILQMILMEIMKYLTEILTRELTKKKNNNNYC